MRKTLSWSALISGLLATPLCAAVPVRGNDPAAPAVQPADPGGDTDKAALLRQQLEKIDAGQPLDAHGMQELQQRINTQIQEHLDRALARVRDLDKSVRLIQVQEAIPVRNMRLEMAPFLGISTSPVSATVREQLRLARGMGLVVDYIEKDSPAAEAGFKVHDVLQKLEDQWLINPQQLMVLVRAKKAGDSVNFTVIRAGKEMTLTAKLGEKEVPPLESLQEPGFWNGPNPWGMNGVPGGVVPGLMGAPEFNMRPDAALRPHQMGSSVRIESDGTEVRTFNDDQNTITLRREKEKNGQPSPAHLLVKDRAGTTIYDGALDQANLPPDIQKKVEDLQKQESRIKIFRSGPDGPQVEAGGSTFGDRAGRGEGTSSVMLSRSDDQHMITMRIETRGNEKVRSLTVKEKPSGKVLFDGPVTSDEDLKSLPADVQEKITKLKAKLDTP